MAPKNSRTNRPAARSSRAPQSARAVRSARAAQSGRIASRGQAGSFSRTNAAPSSYRSAYTPGSQGNSANSAFSRQSAASQYSRNNPNYSAAAKKTSRGKKIALGVLAAILVVALCGGSAFALYVKSINDQLNRGTKSDEELQGIMDALAPAQASKTFEEPFYMMLIGSDRRDNDPSAGARSDTNIVVRVDPTTNQATMISIPRDTKIDIDGYGTNKFNAAYNYGGAGATIREASQLCDVDISHYAEVNFEELEALVDAVGGVDVEVEERIDDPDADNTTDHPDWPRIIIEEGEQHLDGKAALVFARSRAYVDGDFTRTANQRKLIMALVEKVLALPVTELPGVIEKAAQCVTTDLSVTDIIALAQQFKGGGDLTIYSAMVPSTTGYIGEISYVFTDEVALKEMMKIVEEGGDPSGVVSSGYVPADATSSPGSTEQGNGSTDYNSTYYDEPTTPLQNNGYDPNYTDPGYTDPGYTDPGYTDPAPVDPGYVDPGYVDNGTGTGTETYGENATA